jgi:signal transduction histidine kinase
MRRQILIALISLSAVAVLTLLVPASIAVRRALERGDLLDVQRDASVVVSRLPARGPIDVDALGAELGADRRLGVYSGDGALIAGVGPPVADDVVTRGLEGRVAEGWVDGDLVAVVPARFDDAGSPGIVVRIEELGNARERWVEAVGALALSAVAIVGAAGVVGLYLASRLHRPLDELRLWAAQGDVGSVADPPPATGIAELDSLRSTLIEGRARVADLLQRERLFSSRVSHQLRTPVAAIRVALETELDAPRADHTEILTESLGALDRLESTIESLLAFGRRVEQPAAPTDLLELVAKRVEQWQAPFAAAGRTVTVRGEPVMVDVNAHVEHIVDVLLENALEHGVGEVHATVAPALLAGSPGLGVDVADEGSVVAGLDPLADEWLDAAGGIGLRLARSLAESVGGHLELACPHPTTFRLTVPDNRGPS